MYAADMHGRQWFMDYEGQKEKDIIIDGLSYSTFINGLGLRMGSGISPCCFAFSRGGV